MIIAGMVKSSLVDYPGLVSCVLFVPGCNYDCFYCHNRSLIDGTYTIIHSNYIDDFLKKRVGLIDAVVISGGEPTLQPDLIPFIKKIKNLGYKVKIDTNGSSPNVIKELVDNNLCDYFAVDYKAPSGRYKEICSDKAEVKKVLQTISILADSDVDFEVRTTVIPHLALDDLITMAKELPKLPRYILNKYRPPEKYLECDRQKVQKKPYTQDQISYISEEIKKYQPNTVI
jgi:pyruvate formate lyase activating enzyme